MDEAALHNPKQVPQNIGSISDYSLEMSQEMLLQSEVESSGLGHPIMLIRIDCTRVKHSIDG